MKEKILRFVWLIAGLFCLGLGTIGTILPVLPTVPFYMGAAICFAKSSARLHKWFLSTTLYQKYLDNFVKRRAMTCRTKIAVMTMVTLVMGIGFFLMDGIVIGRICMVIVWIFHLFYFTLRVKTVGPEVAYD